MGILTRSVLHDVKMFKFVQILANTICGYMIVIIRWSLAMLGYDPVFDLQGRLCPIGNSPAGWKSGPDRVVSERILDMEGPRKEN